MSRSGYHLFHELEQHIKNCIAAQNPNACASATVTSVICKKCYYKNSKTKSTFCGSFSVVQDVPLQALASGTIMVQYLKKILKNTFQRDILPKMVLK